MESQAPAQALPKPWIATNCQGKLHFLREDQGVLVARNPGHAQTRPLESGEHKGLGHAGAVTQLSWKLYLTKRGCGKVSSTSLGVPCYGVSLVGQVGGQGKTISSSYGPREAPHPYHYSDIVFSPGTRYSNVLLLLLLLLFEVDVFDLES